jgi:hypothetical protein
VTDQMKLPAIDPPQWATVRVASNENDTEK